MRLLAALQAFLLLASLFLPGMAAAAVWTDKADYSPGSVVTISGDNSDDAGYLPGEAVAVVVTGPNGYAAPCSATADESGAWSCQVTLWNSSLAVGDYVYEASGQTSGVVEHGTFTDAINAATTTTLNLSQTTITLGSSVNLSGSLAVSSSGDPAVPAGQTIHLNRYSGSSCPGGSATLITNVATTNPGGVFGPQAFTPATTGTFFLRAVFDGAENGLSGNDKITWQPSNSLCLQLTVNAAPTNIATTTVASGATASYGAASVTLNAAVTPASGPAINSGSVTFTVKDGATTVGAATTDNTVVAGAASVSHPPAGTTAKNYSIEAVYSPGTGFIGSSGTATLTISQAGSTTTVTCPASLTYSGSPQGCTASVTGAGGLSQSLTVHYIGIDGTTYLSSTTAPTDAGNYRASASFDGDANHTDSSDSEDFTIAKAPVTATAGNGSATYDGDPHSPSACQVTGAYTGNLTCANNPASVGPGASTTTIVPVVSGTGLDNFEITPVNGSFTISQASTTTTVTCPASLTYSGSPQGCTASWASDSTDGEGAALTVHYIGIDGTTYLSSTTAPTDAGNYRASASFDGDANHTDSSDSEDFTIAKAPVTATAGNGSATYDGDPHSPSACQVTGAYTGNLTCANNPASVGPGASTTTIVPVVSGTGLDNFEITPVNGSFTISQASTTTTVTCPASLTYSGSPQGCTASWASDSTDGEGAALTVHYIGIDGTTYLSSTTAPTDAGNYRASASFDGDANHTDSSDSEDFTIAKAPVTATAGNGSATYDGDPHSPSACQVTGAYTGNLTCANNPASVGPGASTTTIVPVVSGTGLDNFEITPVNGSFTISQASTTTTVTCPASLTYSGSPQGCTASWASDSTDGEGAALTVHYIGIDGTTYLSSTTAPTDAGNYRASASFDGDANHTDSSDSEDFTIAKAPVTATAGNGSATYDGDPHSPSACQVTGAYTGNLTCANNPASVGPGASTTTIVPVVSGTGLDNFEITPVNGSFTISQASTTTTVTCPASLTYSGSPQGCTASWASDSTDGEGAALTVHYIGIDGTTYLSSTTAPTDAGNYRASASFDGDANHTDSSDSEDFTIAKATLTAVFTVANKVWDGTVAATILTESASGQIGPDTCTLTGGTATFNNPAVGTNKTVTLNGWSLTGTGCSNYQISSPVTTTASIAAWNASGKGFYPPVGATNSIFTTAPIARTCNEHGRAVEHGQGRPDRPLKFNVFAGSVEKTGLTDIQSFNQAKLATCYAGAVGETRSRSSPTGGTTLRYDGTPGSGGQWIQNWKTPKVSGETCYRAWVTFADGSSLEAFFKLRK